MEERAALNAVVATSFEPRRDVILSSLDRPVGPLPQFGPAEMRIKSVTNHRLEFEAGGDQPFLVVIAQTWHPAWQAEVNGKASRVLRANHAFQVVLDSPYVSADAFQVNTPIVVGARGFLSQLL